MTGKEMTKEEIQQAVEVFKPNFDIEKPIQELMNGHYLLCGYAYNVSRELMKYKRAFEILNRDKELTLHKGKDPILGTEEYKLSFVNWKSLTKEEYELLEELVK